MMGCPTVWGEAALGRVLVHLEALGWADEAVRDIKLWARAARSCKALSEWTQYVVFNLPDEEINTWASDDDEGWIEVWKPRRLLRLRVKFEHCSWLHAIREEAAVQERRRRWAGEMGAWIWVATSEDSLDNEREHWLMELHEPRSWDTSASGRSRAPSGRELGWRRRGSAEDGGMDDSPARNPVETGVCQEQVGAGAPTDAARTLREVGNPGGFGRAE